MPSFEEQFKLKALDDLDDHDAQVGCGCTVVFWAFAIGVAVGFALCWFSVAR